MAVTFALENGVVAEFYVPNLPVVTVLPQGTPIAGVDGTNGTNGKTVLNGTGAPSNGLGANGDFYIDTSAWKIYGPKASGAWPVGVSLIGPSGGGGSSSPDSFLLMGA